MIQIGDPIEYAGDRGRIIKVEEHAATVQFWEDKDYHMSTWEMVVPITQAKVLVSNTKAQIERVNKQRQEQTQKDMAKKQPKVVFRLPSYFLICQNCEVVLEYSPMNTETAWSGVQLVHCCECGQAMKVSG